MSHPLPSLLVAALIAMLPASAGAALLPLQATFTLRIANAPAITLSGSGVEASNGFGDVALVPANIFAGNPKVVVPYVTPVGLTSLTVPANSVGNPAGAFGPGDGAMGLAGSVFFYAGGPASSIPLAPIGGGGSANSSIFGVPVKVSGNIWQYATHEVFTAGGFSQKLTATAYDNRTVNGAGTVQLVAPGFLLPSGSIDTIPMMGTLTLTYAPEPGTLVLLGAGVALLTLRARALRS